MYFNLLPILLQLHSFFPESSDDYMKRHTKNIIPGSSDKYYQKSTERSDTFAKIKERTALHREQPGKIFISRQRLQRTRLCFLLRKCIHAPKIYFEKWPYNCENKNPIYLILHIHK